jgi:hypothetical protein
MATAPQTADVLQALEGHALLPAQVALEGEGLGSCPELLHVGIGEIFHPDIRAHPSLAEDLAGSGRTDPIDVGEGDFNPLIARNINTGNPSHERLMQRAGRPREGRMDNSERRGEIAEKSALSLLVLGVGADHHDPSVATNHPALLTHPLD